MRRRRLFAAVVGVVVVGAVVVLADLYSLRTGWPAASPQQDFTVSVRAEVDDGREGETFSIVTRVCSRRWWWRVTSRSPVDWQIIARDGQTVADTSHRMYQMVHMPQLWAPRQCRNHTDEWDQHYWNQGKQPSFVGPARDGPVPAGEYRIRATWTATSERALSRHPTVESPPFVIDR